jgi:hypothetical protein
MTIWFTESNRTAKQVSKCKETYLKDSSLPLPFENVFRVPVDDRQICHPLVTTAFKMKSVWISKKKSEKTTKTFRKGE